MVEKVSELRNFLGGAIFSTDDLISNDFSPFFSYSLLCFFRDPVDSDEDKFHLETSKIGEKTLGEY